MVVGINGFGRIGRAVLRICLQRKIPVSVINNLHGVDDAEYFFKYDSVYGKYKGKIKSGKDYIEIDGKKIKVISESDPEKIPWKEYKVKVVIEATGVFRKREDAKKHFKGGAEKVIITAPTNDSDNMIVPGVNSNRLRKSDNIISVASCTTNALSPVLKVLNDKFGVKEGMMTTIHAYTSSQSLVDNSNKKKRRGRAAGLNMIPTSTGASEAVEKILPELKGKISGFSLRIPLAAGSIIDLTAELKKEFSVNKINQEFRKASKEKMKGIIEYTEEEIVSADIIGDSHSCIVDGLSTQKEGNLVKVFAWYDNEFGYSNRVVDVIQEILKNK